MFCKRPSLFLSAASCQKWPVHFFGRKDVKGIFTKCLSIRSYYITRCFPKGSFPKSQNISLDWSSFLVSANGLIPGFDWKKCWAHSRSFGGREIRKFPVAVARRNLRNDENGGNRKSWHIKIKIIAPEVWKISIDFIVRDSWLASFPPPGFNHTNNLQVCKITF